MSRKARRPVPLDAAALERRYGDGETIEQLAAAFRTSPPTVRRRLKARNVVSRRRGPKGGIPAEKHDAVAREYVIARKSMREIARGFDTDAGVVSRILASKGIAPRARSSL